MKTAYLSLGSNLGDRAENLNTALQLLEQARVHLKRRSSLYETEPQDLRHQPWFYNLVIEVESDLFPLQLLNATQRIEKQMDSRGNGGETDRESRRRKPPSGSQSDSTDE